MNSTVSKRPTAAVCLSAVLAAFVSCAAIQAHANEAGQIDSESLKRLQEEASRPFKRILESAKLQNKKATAEAAVHVAQVRKTRHAQAPRQAPVTASLERAAARVVHDSGARSQPPRAEPAPLQVAGKSGGATGDMPLWDGGSDVTVARVSAPAAPVAPVAFLAPEQPEASAPPTNISRWSSRVRERGG